MWRYPSGIFQQWPPRKRVEFNGSMVDFDTLSAEQADHIGYNRAVPIARDTFTSYVTEWVKGDDFVIRENIVSSTVDEDAKSAHEKKIRSDEIVKELSTLDLFVPRSIEDLIDSGALSAQNLSQYNQDRLARKKELRTELDQL